MDDSTSQPRLSRRQAVSGLFASMAALGLAACARRTQDLAAPTAAPVPTTAPAAPTAPVGAAPPAAPTAQPTVASVSLAAPTPAAAKATPRRGSTLMTATQTDW